MKTSYFATLVTSLFLWNCDGQQTNIKKVDPKDFTDIISKQKEAQIIDVRTPEEFSKEHLDQAKNINWNDDNFKSQISTLDKSKPVFVYCLSGGRSAKAASAMADLGFEVYEMNGGMVKYSAEGLSKSNNERIGMNVYDYKKAIQSADKVLVNFNAKWCAPCKKMAPFISQIEQEMDDSTKLFKVDADAHKSLLKDIEISEIPTLIIYRNGKEVWKHVGYIEEKELRKALEKA